MNSAPWTSLSPRNRRALTVAVAFLGSVLVVRLGVVPYLGVAGALSERLSRERELLARELAAIRESEGHPRNFDRIASRVVAYAPRLLGADSHAAAVAALERVVARHTANAPMTVRGMEPLTASPETSELPRVSLRVEAETDLEGLLSVLAVLEAEPLLLRVHDVVARVVRRPETPDGDARAPPEVLAVAFTVTGFRVATGSPAGDTLARRGKAEPAVSPEDVSRGRLP